MPKREQATFAPLNEVPPRRIGTKIDLNTIVRQPIRSRLQETHVYSIYLCVAEAS
jgi:hypothetical protein